MNNPCALLIDDHAMFRAGLRQVIGEAIPTMQIFEAGTVDEALQCPSERLDVVLLDNQLNGLCGMEGIALIKRKWPLVPILMLTSQYDPATVRRALVRGVAAFLSKGEPVHKIIETLLQVMAGNAAGAQASVPMAPKGLTPRQSAVLGLLHQGMSTKLIARQLFISDNTARSHVQAILEFFGVASRAEAVFAARNQGLVS
jgi:DNA-binding NarL/FixJ family response regulator